MSNSFKSPNSWIPASEYHYWWWPSGIHCLLLDPSRDKCVGRSDLATLDSRCGCHTLHVFELNAFSGCQAWDVWAAAVVPGSQTQ